MSNFDFDIVCFPAIFLLQWENIKLQSLQREPAACRFCCFLETFKWKGRPDWGPQLPFQCFVNPCCGDLLPIHYPLASFRVVLLGLNYFWSKAVSCLYDWLLWLQQLEFHLEIVLISAVESFMRINCVCNVSDNPACFCLRQT